MGLVDVGVLMVVVFAVFCLFFVIKGIRQGMNTSGKKYVGLGVLSLVLGFVLCFVCVSVDSQPDKKYGYVYSDDEDATTKAATEATSYYNEDSADSDDEADVVTAESKNDYSSSSGSFTNKYGTKTTKCVVSSCDNYIASSGDTNCCAKHSNKCGECYCYIDGDAMYCMDCLSGAINGNSNSGSSNSGTFNNKYGTRTTICVVSGCDKYIAKSGDTNCCELHSNKCGECHCYIDSDAMYCMDCLSGALGGSSGSSYSYDSGSSYGSSSGHECYVCGDKAYSKYGSYYYCSECLDLVKAFSE